MNKYVLGVDGGGTKTHCAIFDRDRNSIDLINWGTTNHECLKGSFQELKEELRKLFSLVLNENNVNMNELGKCVFGLSGVDTKSQHAEISAIISELGIKEFILCNDAFLGIKAGCSKGYGVCVINGTGCTVAGISPSGRMLQIGGQGYLTGDKGGGGYLGMTAISSVYDFLFKGGDYTCMTDILFNELKINSKYDFIDTITERLNSKTINSSELCKVVFFAANMGDNLALQLLESMGSEMARSVNGIIRELKIDEAAELDIVLAGSINVKGENSAAINRFKQDVLTKNQNRKIDFKILKQPPVAGAIIWALEGVGDRDAIYNKIVEQFVI